MKRREQIRTNDDKERWKGWQENRRKDDRHKQSYDEVMGSEGEPDGDGGRMSPREQRNDMFW